MSEITDLDIFLLVSKQPTLEFDFEGAAEWTKNSEVEDSLFVCLFSIKVNKMTSLICLINIHENPL